MPKAHKNCCVCNNPSKDSRILICTACKASVHQVCYTGKETKKAPKSWKCLPCKDKVKKPICKICKLGRTAKQRAAFTSTSDEKWVHNICVYFVGGLEHGFSEVPLNELEESEEKEFNRLSNAEVKCKVCKKKNGFRVACPGPCRNGSYHPSCATMEGLIVGPITQLSKTKVRVSAARPSRLQRVVLLEEYENWYAVCKREKCQAASNKNREEIERRNMKIQRGNESSSSKRGKKAKKRKTTSKSDEGSKPKRQKYGKSAKRGTGYKKKKRKKVTVSRGIDSDSESEIDMNEDIDNSEDSDYAPTPKIKKGRKNSRKNKRKRDVKPPQSSSDEGDLDVELSDASDESGSEDSIANDDEDVELQREMNQDFASLTTGIFVEASPTDRDGYLGETPVYHGESLEKQRKRWDAFSQTNYSVEKLIDKLVKDMNNSVFQNISDTLETCHEPFNVHEIPTVMLKAGMNISDHELYFGHLKSHLIETVSHLVVGLHPKDCATLGKALKHLLYSLSSAKEQFIFSEKHSTSSSSSSSSSSNPPAFKSKRATSRVNYSEKRNKRTQKESKVLLPERFDGTPRDVLKSWYDEFADQEDKEKVVVVVESLEGFKTDVLSGLVRTLYSLYSTGMPICLVFGIAGETEILHGILTESDTKKLQITNFQLQSSFQSFQKIISELFLNHSCCVQIGPKTFTFLDDFFLKYNFSLMSFSKLLKFVFLEHFTKNGLSHLALPRVKYDLDRADAGFIRSLRSVQEIGMKNWTEAQKSDDKYLSEQFRKWVDRFFRLRGQRQTAVKLLINLSANLLPVREREKDLSLKLMIKHAEDAEELKTFWRRLKDLRPEELKKVLLFWISLLEKTSFYDRDAPQQLLKTLEETLKNLEVNKDQLEEEKKRQNANLNKMNAAKRRRMMRQHIQTDPAQPIKNKIVRYFEQFTRDYLAPFDTLPAHELFFYNHTQALSKTFTPNPLQTYKNALKHQRYLGDCKCCEERVLTDSREDLCILYDLYENAGRLINLYDIYQSFCMISEEKGESQKILQARFRTAIETLKLMGLIKPSSKRRDHVEKMIVRLQ